MVSPCDHKDCINDIAYDYYGHRIATCSVDHFVKIWDKYDNGSWKCSSSWKAHSGSVWRVCWAHPEFGQVIATCSMDRQVIVWEEQPSSPESSSSWIKRSTFVDSRASVSDVRFAPKHIGLAIACSSYDSVFRVYEAPDPLNLSTWSLQCDIHTKLPTLSCVSWSTSRAFNPLIAVGSSDGTSITESRVQVWEGNLEPGSKKWKHVDMINVAEPVRDLCFAPNVGRSFHLLAVASRNVLLFSIKLSRKDIAHSTESKYHVFTVGNFSEHGTNVWRVRWNTNGNIFSSIDSNGEIILWQSVNVDKWELMAKLKHTSGQHRRDDNRSKSLKDSPNSSSLLRFNKNEK